MELFNHLIEIADEVVEEEDEQDEEEENGERCRPGGTSPPPSHMSLKKFAITRSTTFDMLNSLDLGASLLSVLIGMEEEAEEE